MTHAISMPFAAAAPQLAGNTDCFYVTDNTRPPLSLQAGILQLQLRLSINTDFQQAFLMYMQA